MRIWIVEAIPSYEYEETHPVKAFDSQEKAVKFMLENTLCEDPKPTYLYGALESNEEVDGYFYEAMELE